MPPRKKRTSVPATPEQGGNVAESMQDKRTEKSTKKTYGSRIKQTLKWFVANRPDCLNNSNTAFNLPIPTRELLEYFGHLCMAAHVQLLQGVTTIQNHSRPLFPFFWPQ